MKLSLWKRFLAWIGRIFFGYDYEDEEPDTYDAENAAAEINTVPAYDRKAPTHHDADEASVPERPVQRAQHARSQEAVNSAPKTSLQQVSATLQSVQQERRATPPRQQIPDREQARTADDRPYVDTGEAQGIRQAPQNRHRYQPRQEPARQPQHIQNPEWPMQQERPVRTGRYSRTNVIRSDTPPQTGVPVRREISAPQIPRYRGSDPIPANIPQEQRQRREAPQTQHQEIRSKSQSVGPKWDDRLKQDIGVADILSPQKSKSFESLDDVFAELESVVNDAEEEAMLVNQGPNSSAGKRARVLSMGVPEQLYDELYERGYFDYPNITKDYVNEVLKSYYAKDMSGKIIKGEIEYSQVRDLIYELKMLKENEDLTIDDLKMTEDMQDILRYTDMVIRKIKG